MPARHPAFPSQMTQWEEAGDAEVLPPQLAGYAFLSPWLIGFFCLALGPILASLYLSFTTLRRHQSAALDRARQLRIHVHARRPLLEVAGGDVHLRRHGGAGQAGLRPCRRHAARQGVRGPSALSRALLPAFDPGRLDRRRHPLAPALLARRRRQHRAGGCSASRDQTG